MRSAASPSTWIHGAHWISGKSWFCWPWHCHRKLSWRGESRWVNVGHFFRGIIRSCSRSRINLHPSPSTPPPPPQRACAVLFPLLLAGTSVVVLRRLHRGCTSASPAFPPQGNISRLCWVPWHYSFFFPSFEIFFILKCWFDLRVCAYFLIIVLIYFFCIWLVISTWWLESWVCRCGGQIVRLLCMCRLCVACCRVQRLYFAYFYAHVHVSVFLECSRPRSNLALYWSCKSQETVRDWAVVILLF